MEEGFEFYFTCPICKVRRNLLGNDTNIEYYYEGGRYENHFDNCIKYGSIYNPVTCEGVCGKYTCKECSNQLESSVYTRSLFPSNANDQPTNI